MASSYTPATQQVQPTNGKGTVLTAKQSKAAGLTSVKIPASDTILTVAIELLAVGLFTLIAGASDGLGNSMVMFMLGLWLLYAVMDSQVLVGLVNSLNKVA